MTKKAFDKIAEGLQEALAVAKGEKQPARMTTVVVSRSGVMPVKAFAADRIDGGISLDLIFAHEDTLIEFCERALRDNWEALQSRGWRVIPVIVTPAEEEGRRDGQTAP